MTTTMPQMKVVIDLARERGLDIPILVGGAAVDEAFAESIGAVYGADAHGGGAQRVEAARALAPQFRLPDRGIRREAFRLQTMNAPSLVIRPPLSSVAEPDSGFSVRSFSSRSTQCNIFFKPNSVSLSSNEGNSAAWHLGLRPSCPGRSKIFISCNSMETQRRGFHRIFRIFPFPVCMEKN